MISKILNNSAGSQKKGKLKKRTYKCFEVENAYVYCHRRGFFSTSKSPCFEGELIEIGKGGLSFQCQGKVRKDMKIIANICIQGWANINISGYIKRIILFNGIKLVRIQFEPFGPPKRGWNPIETLDFLRNLEKRHACPQSGRN